MTRSTYPSAASAAARRAASEARRLQEGGRKLPVIMLDATEAAALAALTADGTSMRDAVGRALLLAAGKA